MIIDHSSLSLLSCPRQYQLRVLHQLSAPVGPEARIGSAIHGVIEAFHLQGRDLKSFPLAQVVNDKCEKYNLNGGEIGKVLAGCMAVLPKVRTPLYIDSHPMVELKFDMELSIDNIPVQLQGTVDEIYEQQGRVVVNDYKSTSFKTLDLVIEKYQQSTQVKFYMYMASLMLPPEYILLPLLGHYTVIPYNREPCTIQTTQTQPPAHPMVVDMIRWAMYRMTEIKLTHDAGTLSPPIGMSNGGCRYCAFKEICFHPESLKRLADWPRESYEPLKFR